MPYKICFCLLHAHSSPAPQLHGTWLIHWAAHTYAAGRKLCSTSAVKGTSFPSKHIQHLLIRILAPSYAHMGLIVPAPENPGKAQNGLWQLWPSDVHTNSFYLQEQTRFPARNKTAVSLLCFSAPLLQSSQVDQFTQWSSSFYVYVLAPPN